MDPQELKFRQMTEPPVEKLICKLAVPCIISMLVTSFYNMADTFFVGQLNSNAATGAVGVVFSMMAIIQAVGFFFGQGSGTFISRALGQKNQKEAEEMVATGFYASLAVGLLICVAGQIFLEPLAYLLGSTDTILPHTEAYLQVILLGAPWMTASFVLNNQLRFQGGAMYAMVGITVGAVLNIILDPILIFVANLGVAGAGWATIISQFVSFCLLYAGCNRGNNLRIRFKNIRLRLYYFKGIFQGGLPSLARQCLASLATICLNHAARPHGDAVIAAMERGDMYASTGPLIREISVEDGTVRVECSPAKQIILFSGSKAPKFVIAKNGETLTSAELSLDAVAPYFRVAVIDEQGHTASTRGFFREEYRG